MKIAEQSAQVWGETPLQFQPALERIERAGRQCYQSLDKIETGTARPFLERVLKPVPAHLSVTEHSNMVFRSKKVKLPLELEQRVKTKISSNFIYTGIHRDRVYIFGNFRAWYEMMKPGSFFDLEDSNYLLHTGVDFKRVLENKKLPRFAKAVTVLFKTDRAVSHEIVRHRPCAQSQESQRYVKYDGDMEFIAPSWYDSADSAQKAVWEQSMYLAEHNYKRLLQGGLKAQDARTVLPNSTATSIVTTAYLPEWDHIFYLRTSSAAYPSMRSLMVSAQKQMKRI